MTKLTTHTLAAVAGAALILILGADGSGKLTGVVRGMDEEAKVVHAIQDAQTYDFRLHVAYFYAIAELKAESFYTNDPTGAHTRAMDHCIVCELRRSMLCEDAPDWIKEQLPNTRWWSTNTVLGVPWRWESGRSTIQPASWSRSGLQ